MRRIAIINQKGGVGKTTTAVNVGVALARAGQRVLLIDLDPQAHLTLHLGQDPVAGHPGTYEMLTGAATIAKARRKVATNLWLVGASIDLAGAEVELISTVGREVILRDLLEQHVGAGKNGRGPQYDYVLMDCPPSLTVLTLNGLCAASEVLIPLQPHYLALQGLGKLLETVALVAKRINPVLKVTGVLVCMNDAGTRLASEVIDDVRSYFAAARKAEVPWADARVFETVVRRNIKLAEAPSHGQSVFDYAPDSNGAKDYEAVARELHELAGFGKRAADQTPAMAEQMEPRAEVAPMAEPGPARHDELEAGLTKAVGTEEVAAADAKRRMQTRPATKIKPKPGKRASPAVTGTPTAAPESQTSPLGTSTAEAACGSGPALANAG